MTGAFGSWSWSWSGRAEPPLPGDLFVAGPDGPPPVPGWTLELDRARRHGHYTWDGTVAVELGPAIPVERGVWASGGWQLFLAGSWATFACAQFVEAVQADTELAGVVRLFVASLAGVGAWWSFSRGAHRLAEDRP